MELTEAENESNALAYVLSDLISIKSHKYTVPRLSGYEAVDSNRVTHVRGTFVLMWDIEGAPADLGNIHEVSEILNLDKPQMNVHVGYLAKAVFLEYQHFPDHALIELFKIIEDDDTFPFYYKYWALRNILAHSPTYYEKTVKHFLNYFNENTFDYLKYELDDKSIILNLHSDKTQNELNVLVKHLMNEIRIYLKIH